jgi:hypothetical protein
LTTLSLWPLLPAVAADMTAPAKAPPITAFFCRIDQKHSTFIKKEGSSLQTAGMQIDQVKTLEQVVS